MASTGGAQDISYQWPQGPQLPSIVKQFVLPNERVQPGGNPMAAWGQGGGMPGMGAPGQTAAAPQATPPGASPFGGSTNIPQWMQNMSPDQLKAFLTLMWSRGAGGMQPNASPAGQAMAQMRGPGGAPAMQSPGTQGLANQLQGPAAGVGNLPPGLLQYVLGQSQGGQYPGQGGGVDLSNGAGILAMLGLGNRSA